MLEIMYAFTYTMTGYLKWKRKALELFSSVYDLDTLSRIMRRKKLAAEKISECASTILIGSIIATVVIIEYAKYCIEHLSELVVTHVIIAISLLLAMVICVCMFCVFLLRRMQFYQHCLELLK